MNSTILKVDGLFKSYVGVQALVDFSCEVERGKIIGLIGPNGAGKTTLFNVITGFQEADRGNAHFNGIELLGTAAHRVANLGIARTFQEMRLVRQISVLDNVMLAFKNNPGDNLLNVLFRWKNVFNHEKQYKQKALALLEEVGLLEMAHEPAESLSYGQQKLLSLMVCIASNAELVLLDEPVSGVNPEMLDRILATIRELTKSGTTVILIEHHLEVVSQLCDRVIFMDSGRLICEGPYAEVKTDQRVIKSYLG